MCFGCRVCFCHLLFKTAVFPYFLLVFLLCFYLFSFPIRFLCTALRALQSSLYDYIN